MDDIGYMKQVLKLAKKGTGKVSPNPRVGAIIVKHGQVLSTGYHSHYGKDHAEINAISKLSSDDLKGSTLYVNLEPCSHHGKTPPCADKIVNSGITDVVIGMIDPNPKVAGKGVIKLEDNGILVKTNILNDLCVEINKEFIKYIKTKTPYVTIKIAQTLDGFIATENGLSKWITNEKSRRYVHSVRHENDAILVGINTILKDNPSLDVRYGKKSRLKRFILDSQLKIPNDSKVLNHFDPENTYIITTEQADSNKLSNLLNSGVQVWKMGKNQINLNELLIKMGSIGVASLLVEGGGQVYTSFLKEKLVDRVLIFYAPKIFGKGISSLNDLGILSPDSAIQFTNSQWKKIGDNMLFEGRF